MPDPVQGNDVRRRDVVEARQLFRKLLLLATPLLILASGVAAIDPFRFFRIVELLPAAEKLQVAGARDPALWALARYAEDPSSAVLLGDSRMANMPLAGIREHSGTRFAMLAFGGANLREMIDAFWVANSTVRLQEVVMSVGFSQWAVPDPVDRVAVFSSWQDNPLLYLINRTVLKSSVALVKSRRETGENAVARPDMDRETFWQSQLSYYGDRVMTGFAEHYGQRERLDAMARYYRESGIELTFVIMPTSPDLHERIDVYRRQVELEAFRRHLSTLATTLDLDTGDAYWSVPSRFIDPVHVSPAEHEHVIRAIWPQGPRVHASGPS